MCGFLEAREFRLGFPIRILWRLLAEEERAKVSGRFEDLFRAPKVLLAEIIPVTSFFEFYGFFPPSWARGVTKFCFLIRCTRCAGLPPYALNAVCSNFWSFLTSPRMWCKIL